MEHLLVFLLFVKYNLIALGILSFTLMCLIGTVMAIDELQLYLARPAVEINRRRIQKRIDKHTSEAELEQFFTEMVKGFDDTGRLRTGAYLKGPTPKTADEMLAEMMERAHQEWQAEETEKIRDDLR